MPKKALIYGAGGQDGHYLAKFLSAKKYELAGVIRAKDGLDLRDMKIYVRDATRNLNEFVSCAFDFEPDEIYYLAGINSHSEAEKDPSTAFRVNTVAPLNIMREIIRQNLGAKFFYASSSYIFEGSSGKVNEKTAATPQSTYALSKYAAHQALQQFRSQGAHFCNGILFNHESPLRQPYFVTRKISLAVAKIYAGKTQGSLLLGNLNAKRDWGFAGDYVEAMWLMLQQKEPDDYVIATGESHSVREFCEEAFSYVGLDWKKYVKSDPALFRKDEISVEADNSKIRRVLGWNPKVKFKELVRMMVDADIKLIKEGGEV